MNYYLIKNIFEIIPYDYPDKYDITIYFIDDYECQVVTNRLDSNDGWGLILEIKIFDILNNNYEILKIGNSLLNNKISYFKTNIFLEYNDNKIAIIPKVLLPRNEFLVLNKYEIVKNCNTFIDLHIVLYYIEEYKIKIIVRRLDDEGGWSNNLKLFLHDFNDPYTKEYITIGQSNRNYKFLIKDTKIKLFKNEHTYSQDIPKIIFQTGMTSRFKNILHFNSIMSFIELNPEYFYIYYNDMDCRYFLRDHYNEDVIHAYDMLVPGAFKADLLRYCFLYINGGCYFDCKQILRIPIRYFLEITKTFVICNDVIDKALLNAIIFSSPKNIIMEKTINDCVYNIINKLGKDPLDISGPEFFYRTIKPYINNETLILKNNRPSDNFSDFCVDYINNNISLIKNNKIILSRFYKGYYDNYLDTTHYGILYKNNEIYYKNFQQIGNYRICIYPNNFDDIFTFNIINKKKLIIKRVDTIEGWTFDLKVMIMNQYYEEWIIKVGLSKQNTKEIIIDIT
jgi:mannosyltransferase OCH1-like enzyme